MLNFERARDIADLNYKVLLYGPAGGGKSWAAATARGAVSDGSDVLILLTEQNGLQSIRRSNPNAMIVRCWGEHGDIEDVRKFLRAALKGELPSGIRTVVFDSLTEIQRLMKDEIQRQKGGADKLTMQDWGVLTEKMRMLMRTIRDIPYNVVCTGLDQSEISEADGIRYVEPSFQGKKLPGEVAQYFNLVGFVIKREVENDSGEKSWVHRIMLDGPARYTTKSCSPLHGVVEPNLAGWWELLNELPSEDENPNDGAHAEGE